MNIFDLTGKIALVTGGAHSIGFAIGCGLAQAGATICFNCTNEDSMRRGIANYAAEGITASKRLSTPAASVRAEATAWALAGLFSIPT